MPIEKENNNKRIKIEKEIKLQLREYFGLNDSVFNPLVDRLPLSVPAYNSDDVSEALESILKGWPTMGPKVRRLEDKMANMIGVKNAVMVNSGGSANFIIMYLLSSIYAHSDHRLKPGDEIITPAVTWSTTVSPILQAGCVPVIVDINLGTYDINTDKIENNITERTKALMIVHALGHSCEMDKILKICKKHSLILIEDTCESIGANYKNKPLGSFGNFASFSFYFSHHITSIEGGMITTNDDIYADIIRSMRANGWYRDIRGKKTKDRIINDNSNIDTSFMFPYTGFNLKPTDVAAGLLLNQIDRLEEYIDRRRSFAERLTKCLEKFSDYLILPYERELCMHSWFSYPIVVKKSAPFEKHSIVNYLYKNRIDNRPIIAGNIVDQPFLKDYKFKHGDLNNAKLVMDNGFFIGLHHKLNNEKIKYIKYVFENFFEKI